jgi:hypothetical protein
MWHHKTYSAVYHFAFLDSAVSSPCIYKKVLWLMKEVKGIGGFYHDNLQKVLLFFFLPVAIDWPFG